MATTKPYIAAALFCESILSEEGGLKSLMRIIDTGEIQLPPNFPLKPAVDLKMVVMLKAESTMVCRVEIVGHTPAGKVFGRFRPVDLQLQREVGANVIAPLRFPVVEFGTYWFDVVVDGEVLTRTPLMLKRAESGPASPSGPQPPNPSTAP